MPPRGLKHNSADANYVDRLGNLKSILQRSTIPEDVRRDVAGSQLRNKNATHPTAEDEMRVINSINITILPVDKGGALVVLDTGIQGKGHPATSSRHNKSRPYFRPHAEADQSHPKYTGQTGARRSPTKNCTACDITEGNFNCSCQRSYLDP